MPKTTPTAVAGSSMQKHLSSGMPMWSCGPQTVSLDASATEFYPVIAPKPAKTTYLSATPLLEKGANPRHACSLILG